MLRCRWFVHSLFIVSVGLACSDDDGAGETGDGGGDVETFPGLSADVEIRRDGLGIPHIYGQTDLDVMYGAGYQMARDRLFQMDLVRRRALGRQAEVLGPDKVEQDELSRLMNFRAWGEANRQRLLAEDPDTHALVVAWLAGVNARIDEVRDGTVPRPYGFGPDELDYLPERWDIADHYAVARLFFFASSAQLEEELFATLLESFIPDAFSALQLAKPMFPTATMPPDERPEVSLRPRSGDSVRRGQGGGVVPRGLDLAAATERMRRLHEAMLVAPKTGSNNWAVAGRHTDSGSPIICGDPHQPLDSPSVMYAQHLNSMDGDGTLDAIGFSFVGVAGVHLGHNRSFAWTATTNFADTSDTWLVESAADAVKIGDQMVPVVRREEVIEIRGAEAETYVVEDVPGYGVILPNDIVPIPIAGTGEKLLFNWTGFQTTTDESGFVRIAFAPDVETFEGSVDQLQISGFNFVGADADDIAYRVNLLVPDRGDPSARRMPWTTSDGNDPNTFWTDYLPPERLPRSRGGARGWLMTANNDPWGFTFDGDVQNDPWYYGHFFAAGHRAHRLEEELTRLTGEGKVTVEDMKTLQMDTHAATSDVLLPLLETAWTNAQNEPSLAGYRDDADVAALVQLLTVDWDRRMERESAGALAYHLFLMLASDEAVADEFSIFWSTLLEAEPPFIIKMPLLALDGQYPQGATLIQDGVDATVLEALSRTAEELKSRFGSVDPSGYTWAAVHGTYFDNPYGGELDGGWTPSRGGEDTVAVSSSQFLDGGSVADRFDASSGSIYRMVTSFDADGVPRAELQFPRGNVGEPDSPFFDNTLEAWAEGEYAPLPFRRAEVEAQTRESFTLEKP